MAERIDPSTISMPEGTEDDIRRFVEADFKIRSGLCPNGCGLMIEESCGLLQLQTCQVCKFSTNAKAERGESQ